MAQAGRALTTNCPVARLARDAAGVINAHHHADRRGGGGNDMMDTLIERLEAIEDAATYERSVSPLGSLFQALLLAGDLDPDDTWVQGGRTAARVVRRLRRLISSITSQLEASTDDEIVQVLRFHYFSHGKDELSTLQAVVATFGAVRH